MIRVQGLGFFRLRKPREVPVKVCRNSGIRAQDSAELYGVVLGIKGHGNSRVHGPKHV